MTKEEIKNKLHDVKNKMFTMTLTDNINKEEWNKLFEEQLRLEKELLKDNKMKRYK